MLGWSGVFVPLFSVLACPRYIFHFCWPPSGSTDLFLLSSLLSGARLGHPGLTKLSERHGCSSVLNLPCTGYLRSSAEFRRKSHLPLFPSNCWLSHKHPGFRVFRLSSAFSLGCHGLGSTFTYPLGSLGQQLHYRPVHVSFQVIAFSSVWLVREISRTSRNWLQVVSRSSNSSDG